jgi:hypothetical protein
MKGIGWIACTAVVVGLLCESGRVQAQFGGGGGEAKESPKESRASAVEPAAPLMRGTDYDAAQAPNEPCRCTGEGGAARIKQALAHPLISAGMEFTDTSLEEVVSQLQDDYQMPIQLDLPALDNAGLGPDEPLTISLRGISLRSALRLLLKQIQLTYIIQDEVLIITTPEEAEAQLSVCVYDVGDLIGAKGQALDALIDAIVSCAATETWAENGGGEAEIRPLPPRFLVISQTQPVHEEIGDLLATIRAMRGGAQVSHQPTTVAEPQPTPYTE